MNRPTDIIYQMYKPSPDLAHMVSFYFLYQRTADTQGQEFALSDGNPGISFVLNQPYPFRSSGQEYISTSEAFVCGAFTKGLYAEKTTSPQKMFGVKFTTDGLYYLLKESLAGLKEKPVWNLEIVLGSQATRLAELILEAPEVAQQIHLLETYFRQNIHFSKEPDIKFRQAAGLIRQTQGKLPIEEIAYKLSLNYKWLERKFIAYTGTTPKEFSRLIRFIHTYFHFKRTGLADLMDIAIYNGYYDQNHFIKEFKYFTGYTPTQLQQAPVFDLAAIMEPLTKTRDV
jgi:AraC-like DNA-binding protein